MVARNSAEGVPEGWTVHCKVLSSGRKLKYYTDPTTGRKFYSKNEVYYFINKGGNLSESPTIGRRQSDREMVVQNSAEGVPEGWTVHCKVLSSGRKLKYYTHPKTGRKFYSKNEVYCYINKGGKSDKAQSSNQKLCNSTIERTPHGISNVNTHFTWPPKGWLIDFKRYEAGPSIGKLYKIYTDKSTGHKCYSKPQVLQYLKKQQDKGCMVREFKKAIVTRSNSCQHGNCSKAEIDEHLNNVKVRTHPPGKKKLRSIKNVIYGNCQGNMSDHDAKTIGDGIRTTSTAKAQKASNNVIHPQTPADRGTCVSRSLSICDSHAIGVQTRGSKERHQLDSDDRYTSTSANVLKGDISPIGKCNLHYGCTSSKNRGSGTLPSRFSKRLAGFEPEVETIPIPNDSGRGRRGLALLRIGNMKVQENGYEFMSVTEVDPILEVEDENKGSIGKNSYISSHVTEGNRGSLSCRRFSKRLAGLELELGALVDFSEKAIRNTGKRSCDFETLTFSSPALNCVAHQSYQQTSVEAQQSNMRRGLLDKRKSENGLELHQSNNLGSNAGNSKSKTEKSRRYSKRLAGAEPEITLDLAGEGEAQSHLPNISQVIVPQKVEHCKTDSEALQQNPIWLILSDPCLEFAVKTLTGEISIEDDLQIQSYFQQIKKPAQKDDDPNSDASVRYNEIEIVPRQPIQAEKKKQEDTLASCH